MYLSLLQRSAELLIIYIFVFKKKSIFAKELQQQELDVNGDGLRRSKRVKVGNGYNPIYEWQEIRDYNGNIVRVLGKVGARPKRELFVFPLKKGADSHKALEQLKAERQKNAEKLEKEAEPLKIKDKEESPIKKKYTNEKKQLKYEAKVRNKKEEKRRLKLASQGKAASTKQVCLAQTIYSN